MGKAQLVRFCFHQEIKTLFLIGFHSAKDELHERKGEGKTPINPRVAENRIEIKLNSNTRTTIKM